MRKHLFILGSLLLLLLGNGATLHAEKQPVSFKGAFEIAVPEATLTGLETSIKVKLNPGPWGDLEEVVFASGAEEYTVVLEDGEGTFPVVFESGEQQFQLKKADFEFSARVNPIPAWMSLIPPLLAIIMALAFREVITSIGAGIFVGAAIIGFYAEGVTGIASGFLAVIDTYIINSLNDSGHLSIIIFSMLIGALVSVISRNGGMQGVVNHISKFAGNAKSGQLATWILGVAIFFDDYANTLVVGNTMRSVTDKLRISREKLSYLVDSTAAPIAAIAFVTTWIGAELGYIESGISSIPEVEANEGVYSIFLNSLAYSFYPIFTLVFMLILIVRNRDFGPMYKAEVRARTTGQVAKPRTDAPEMDDSEVEEFKAVEGVKQRAFNGIIPIMVVIISTIVGIAYTGYMAEGWKEPGLSFSQKLSTIVGDADSYVALLWASGLALVTAVILTISQRLMSLADTIDSVLKGFKAMLPAIIILVLAWSLALVTEHLHTADFLAGNLGNAISPIWVPTITFVLAAIVAFSTGSSWGTMAILYPLLIPTAWEITSGAEWTYVESMPILYNTVACVLAGAVLGDHCSPISDTTILSSLASSCNHIDHVRTQLPYALTVGVVATLVGTLPAALGISSWLLFPLGIAALYGVIHFFGKEVDAPPSA